MCGIIGYLGDKNASKILIDGLKKLEYRGYDSAGIAVVANDGIKCLKSKGRVADLEKKLLEDPIEGSFGIGHTRWATHGIPSEINAHPHLDCKKQIAVVHNGIIENYNSLKDLLIKEGHKFVSETDTEVISHLIEKFYAGNLEEATIKALKLVEGTFGLAIISKFERKIVAARRGSPLVVGIGDSEKIIASDVVPILSHTKKVVYLKDNEMAIITDKDFRIESLDGKEVEKKVEEIKWDVGQIEKKGFKYFMLKEIFEQPEAIANTLRGRVKDGKIKLTVDFDANSIKRITILACGTSWHSALIGKYFIEKISGIPTEVDYASEFRYRDPIIRKDDLAVVISQSGETADTLAALREAKKFGAKTLGIINVVGSTIAREVDSGIYLHAGPEIGVASTKAFTCQITALLLLALSLAEKRGLRIEQDVVDELLSAPQKIKKILGSLEDIKKMAEKFKDSRDFLYLGRGLNFPVALEGALKLKEISYIHAEGYPAAEMKHGPIALIDENMPVLFIVPKDNTYEKIISNMEEVKARGGKIIAVVSEDDKKISKLTENIIKVPPCHQYLTPLINVIPLQLLAYYVADLKGINVDKPRNLAKSVTVE
ncbi:MAG: glutamine--fructose-6-phosphate transaminase (isomerizing) [Candidatus Staskawiczbacteria bacterium]|nr:glutamine--fructose-6-phosphate transaminase (isomerizing) [Candidatus Staskawiczbacteria bacterium]